MARTPIKPRLVLLAGPAGCGKTEVCTSAFEAALGDSSNLLDDDLLFILPTAEHRARMIDLVLRRGLAGFFQRRITTFDRALREFLKLGGFDFATDVTRRIILKEILTRTKFRYFEAAAQTSGFVELLGRAIIELKEFLISPHEFKRKCEALKSRFPEFQLKYEDLAGLYLDYDRELKKRGLIDQRDSLKLLEAGIERGEYAHPELRNVWIDGFSDFTKLQFSFIEFLTRHAGEVTVTLTLDDDPGRRALFQIVSETKEQLEELGFVTEWQPGRNMRARSPALRHLEANLFRAPQVERPEPDETIQIFEATGVSGEIEMIAREIKRLVRTHGYNFSDIVLIFRHTGPYVSVVKSIFRKFEIPAELHERLRLRVNPVARTLVSFFKILLADWTREDLFNFLKSSYVVKDYGEIARMELEAFRKGIFRDRAYWLASFPSEAFQDIARFEDEFRSLKSVDQFENWTKRVMAHFGLLRFRDALDEKTREDREAAKRLLLLLEELKRKRRFRSSAAPEHFAQELLALIEVDLFSVHARDKNRVQIYNVSLARQKEYKAVFAAGLLEKQFPIQVKEDPILSDRERSALNEKGEVLKERLPRQAFERYLFYMAVSRAGERLILSYPRFDLEGREALPSFYVEEVRQLFSSEIKRKKQLITDVLPDWEEVASEHEAEARCVRALWQIPEGPENKERDKLALSIYNRLLASPALSRTMRKLLRPIEGALHDHEVKPYLLPESGIWSPTILEEYAECPYRYFSDRVLKLEAQGEGIDLKRRGIILHDVLEQFFTWMQARKKGKVSFEEAKEFCLARFKKLWAEEPLSGDRYYKIELERRHMEEMLIQVLELEVLQKRPPIEGLKPSYFEYRFGFDEAKKDFLVLKLESGEILLRGKIDRVDIDPSGRFALVIDYKTNKSFKSGKLANGTCLQLPLYLLAVKQRLGLEALGAHFYSLTDAKTSGFHHQDNLDEAGLSTIKRNKLSEAEFDDFMGRTVRSAGRYVRQIENAQIPVRPRDCVTYCEYSSVCRIEKWRLKHMYREIAEEDARCAKEKVSV